MKKDCERFKKVKAIALSLIHQNGKEMFNQNLKAMKKLILAVSLLFVLVNGILLFGGHKENVSKWNSLARINKGETTEFYYSKTNTDSVRCIVVNKGVTISDIKYVSK